MAALAGLHHAALSVRDLDASIQWYGDVLGLEPTFRQDLDTRRVVVMRFPGLRQTLGLVQHTGGEAFDPRNLGLDHVAFSVSSGEELEAWAGRLDERGVTHSGPTETPFGGMLNFADLDGIALALFWERT
jgi:glyoxylase I family protein